MTTFPDLFLPPSGPYRFVLVLPNEGYNVSLDGTLTHTLTREGDERLWHLRDRAGQLIEQPNAYRYTLMKALQRSIDVSLAT